VKCLKDKLINKIRKIEILMWERIKMNRKIRILFCYPQSASFVQRDFEILKKYFDVKGPEFGLSFGVRTFLRQTRHYVTRFSKNTGTQSSKFPPLELIKYFLWADLTFSWFAQSSTVLLSKIFGKKSVVVVGGYDIASVPETGYGEMLNPRRARNVKFILEHADRILPFSNYAKEVVLKITKKAHIDTIRLTCNTRRFRHGREKKENIVLTVCYINKDNIVRKGLETFLESACLLPEIRFVLIGAYTNDSINYLRKISPSNVKFTGHVSEEELIRWYQRAKVYCQLSYEEGFGVSVIEAMACQCVPVVSSKAVVLKEVVGDCGFYVPYGDAKATANAIEKALSVPLDLGAKARKRVIDLFSIEKREKELLRLINNVVHGHR
jgi:glycosyltransferase involved in cell wall biosynthesis